MKKHDGALTFPSKEAIVTCFNNMFLFLSLHVLPVFSSSVLCPSIFPSSACYSCWSPLSISPPTSLFPGRSSLFPFEDGFLDDGHGDPSLTPGLNSPTRCQNGERMERYSRKVFVGGLPPDIDEGTDGWQWH